MVRREILLVAFHRTICGRNCRQLTALNVACSATTFVGPSSLESLYRQQVVYGAEKWFEDIPALCTSFPLVKECAGVLHVELSRMFVMASNPRHSVYGRLPAAFAIRAVEASHAEDITITAAGELC